MASTSGLKIGDPVYRWPVGEIVGRVHTVEGKFFGFAGLGDAPLPRGILYVEVDGERIQIPDESERIADVAVMADG
jgi:hypothetical protein